MKFDQIVIIFENMDAFSIKKKHIEYLELYDVKKVLGYDGYNKIEFKRKVASSVVLHLKSSANKAKNLLPDDLVYLYDDAFERLLMNDISSLHFYKKNKLVSVIDVEWKSGQEGKNMNQNVQHLNRGELGILVSKDRGWYDYF